MHKPNETRSEIVNSNENFPNELTQRIFVTKIIFSPNETEQIHNVLDFTATRIQTSPGNCRAETPKSRWRNVERILYLNFATLWTAKLAFHFTFFFWCLGVSYSNATSMINYFAWHSIRVFCWFSCSLLSVVLQCRFLFRNKSVENWLRSLSVKDVDCWYGAEHGWPMLSWIA